MSYPTISNFDHIIHHLRQQRDDLDALIKYLEDLEDYRQKNSFVLSNPNIGGAAQAAASCKIGTIGDEPPCRHQ